MKCSICGLDKNKHTITTFVGIKPIDVCLTCLTNTETKKEAIMKKDEICLVYHIQVKTQ